jgi:hypothetical protein
LIQLSSSCLRHRIQLALCRLAAQVFVDFVKQGECKNHERAAEREPGLLPRVWFSEWFAMDPGVGLVLVVRAAARPLSSLAASFVAGICLTVAFRQIPAHSSSGKYLRDWCEAFRVCPDTPDGRAGSMVLTLQLSSVALRSCRLTA